HDVVEAVLTLLVHPPDAVLNDHRNLIDVSRIIRRARWDHAGEHHTVPILVLQALAQQRGASGSATQQEALSPCISERPYQVANALKTEHEIEDEKGDGRPLLV